MSGGQYLENFSPRIKQAIQELQKIQRTRKYRMAEKHQLGHGRAIWVDAEGKTTGKFTGIIYLENNFGTLALCIGPARILCSQITDWSYIEKVATFHVKDDPSTTKVILTVDSADHIKNLMAYVKLPPVPRPLTYEHDGNITSSPSESEDSPRGRTTGSVENSFESDDPSTHESV